MLQIERRKSEHARILEVVTTTIGHWGDWDKIDGYFGRCEEISKLEDYLEFHARQEQYKEILKRIDLELQERREAYVHEQLNLYDNAHLMKE